MSFRAFGRAALRAFASFVATAASAVAARAQQIPGRDLLEFPIGSVSEGAALSLLTGDGLRNPAAILLPSRVAFRAGISTLLTDADQGVSAQTASLAAALGPATVGLSVTRAAVNGIVRTETDPQSIGGDVPYGALVVSALAARRQTRRLSTGLAVRYIRGELDVEQRSTVGVDGGLVLDGIGKLDGRIGVSSFFWRPGSHRGDGASFSGAADARLAGSDTASQVRAGYTYTNSPGLSREHYLSATGRLGVWEARLGVARIGAYGHTSTRARFAVGVHYGRYLVALAREDNPSGLVPSYQFTLTRSFSRS